MFEGHKASDGPGSTTRIPESSRISAHSPKADNGVYGTISSEDPPTTVQLGHVKIRPAAGHKVVHSFNLTLSRPVGHS